MPGAASSWEAFSWVFPVATHALAVPRLRASRRWRAPSRVWVRPAATAVSPVMAPRYRLPFLALARPLRLPDWWSCGARPAQEDRCAPLGNLLMSEPVSATASWAARRPQPGIDSACCSCSSYRASSRSITAVRSSMSADSPVDARQHLGQQRGMLIGEELRALQCLLQL